MIATIGLGLFLVALAGICEAIMDVLQFHFNGSVFDKRKNLNFWNPVMSWTNKYKSDLKTPKFFLSTTLLVCLTDAWHLFKMVRTFLLFIGLPIAVYNLCFVELCVVGALARSLYGLIFTLCFDVFSNR